MDPKDAILNREAEEKDNAKFEEINKIPETERTDEQKKELQELKERYGKRMQKKIDTMTAKQRATEEENERLRQELEESKKNTAVKEKEVITESLKEEVLEIGGKKYFTDAALLAQVKSGEISEEDAYAYQRKRDKEEIKWDLKREHEEEERRKSDINVRKEDSDKVLRENPTFSKKHPDFDSEDPLYKLANELYLEGYAANPRGLSLAIKRAKEILRISGKVDASDDHDIEGSEASERARDRNKEVTLSESEKEAAVRMFTRGDVINPKTNRPYTVNEALVKALNAKKERMIK